MLLVFKTSLNHTYLSTSLLPKLDNIYISKYFPCHLIYYKPVLRSPIQEYIPYPIYSDSGVGVHTLVDTHKGRN